MRLPVKICISLNKLFPMQVHPFNLNNDGVKTYAEWQYDKGIETIKLYLKTTSTEKMFEDKKVLDIGCGAGGKTIYYASQGVSEIVGLEILEKYEEEANKLAKDKGYEDVFTFTSQDAAKTNFSDNTFDTIIMNDAMEHVDEPDKVLAECYRILKKGGKLYLNFPPYNHPYGAHLSDAIAMPWVHCFFSDQTLIEAYKELVKDLPDGNDRIKFRISTNVQGREYFSYINHMSVKRYNRILSNSPFKVNYYSEEHLRNIVKPLAKLPFFKEYFVKMVVSVVEK